MPQKSSFTPILGDNYYHIYNRANNSMPLFYNNTNYFLFLKFIRIYLENYAEVLAYCLIPNHFHLLIKTTRKLIIQENEDLKTITDLEVIGAKVSEQFRQMFIKYAYIIKSQENIKGSIFQKPFKRVLIESESQLLKTLFYIHYNPVKHNVRSDYTIYQYSSYKALTTNCKTNIARDHVITLFGSVQNLIEFHQFCWDVKKDLALEV